MTTYFSTRNNVLSFADINISQQNVVESRFFKSSSGEKEIASSSQEVRKLLGDRGKNNSV